MVTVTSDRMMYEVLTVVVYFEFFARVGGGKLVVSWAVPMNVK